MQLYESTPEAVKSEMATFFTVFPNGIIAGNTFRGVGYDTVLLGQEGPTRIDRRRARRAPERSGVRARRAITAGRWRRIRRRSAGKLRGPGGRPAALAAGDATINHDGDLRLQYLAGLGLNANEGDRVYAEILKYRRYPDDLFVGSDSTLAALRSRITRQ